MTGTDTSIPIAPQALLAQERARRASLVALGIAPMVSRVDPAGAKPGERYVAPEQSHSEMSPVAASESSEAQGAPLCAMVQGAGEAPRGRAQQAQSETEPTNTDAIYTSIGTPDRCASLSLVIVTSGDVLWVEVLEDKLLRQEQLQLIEAMARAVRGASVRCEQQQFNWPPSGQNPLAAAPGGLGDMLSGFLQRLTADHQIQLMICMGPCESLPDTGLPVYYIPSSMGMLRDGALKQTAWATLKPLCRSG